MINRFTTALIIAISMPGLCAAETTDASKMTPGAVVKILPMTGDVPLGATTISEPSSRLLPIITASGVAPSMMGRVKFREESFMHVDKAGKWGLVLKLVGEDANETRLKAQVNCTASWSINDQNVVQMQDKFGANETGLLQPVASGGIDLEPGFYKSQIDLNCPDLNPLRLGKVIKMTVQVVPPGESSPIDPSATMFLRAVQ